MNAEPPRLVRGRQALCLHRAAKLAENLYTEGVGWAGGGGGLRACVVSADPGSQGQMLLEAGPPKPHRAPDPCRAGRC